ncbi:hypothetical protein [Sphingopyxis sp. LK2115]|uniref:hypothetical protein n=1 Tax=Sphingopyxis sp. LK2115 TaxID=2744558 RepID=UPI001660FCF4|nr:hypothetical protein [Sphingopyxis sp. LK2115]
MAGVLCALLGAGSDGQRFDLPVSYYAWGDKYSAGEQYGADGGYFSYLSGGNFTPVAWQGRTIRALVHSYDFYASTSTTLIGIDGYNATPAPQRLRINGTNFTLGAGSVAWLTNVTGITFSPSPTNNINWTSHGLAVGDPVQFYCTGGMPTGITAFTIYFVQSVVSASAFKIAATPGGAAISFTGSGSGTRYGYKNPITSYQAFSALSGNPFASVLHHLEVVLHTGRPTELLHHAAQREIVMETPGELTHRKIATAVLDIVAAGRPALGDRPLGTLEDVVGPSVDRDRHVLAQGPFHPGIDHLGNGEVEPGRHEFQHRPEPPGIG